MVSQLKITFWRIFEEHRLKVRFWYINSCNFCTIRRIWNFLEFLAHLGPLRGNKLKEKCESYSSIIYQWIQMSFERFIFNWNPYNLFDADFFFVILQVLPVEEIIVDKISHGGGGGAHHYNMFNLRRMDLK